MAADQTTPQFNYARDLIYALDYLLDGWGCPSYLRPFIQKVLILAADQPTPISDKEFSMLLGRSRHNMTHLRARLKEWQADINAKIIDVIEHDYIPGAKTQKATEYSFAPFELLLEVVTQARAQGKYARDWKGAIRGMARVQSGLTETAPLWRERKPRREPEHEKRAKTLLKLFGTIARRNFEHAFMRERSIEQAERMRLLLNNKVDLEFDEWKDKGRKRR